MRDINTGLIAVFLVGDAEQQFRNIDRHSFRIACTVFEPPFVRKRQDRKAAHLPGIRESRLKRVLILIISILGEQHLSVLLAVIPKGAVAEIARELEIGKHDEVEVEFRENGP